MRPLDTLRTVGRPIAYYSGIAKHVGGVNAAILLCQLMYWDELAGDQELGVYKTSEEWEEETGLSYREQAGARKKLRDLGLLVETVQRLKHRIYYRLDHDAFNAFMESLSKPKGGGEGDENEGESANDQSAPPQLHKPQSPNDENAIGEQPKAQSAGNPKRKSLIDTENTAETTTEITSSGDAAEATECQFTKFWLAYPNTPRRVAKRKCLEKWKAEKLDRFADEIIDHVRAMAKTKQWRDGYEPAPLTYLNQSRWEDGLPEPAQAQGSQGSASPLYDQNMAAAEQARQMLFGDDNATV
ncbi:hypothetical protein L1889_18185 [Paenalcaligenes niemegkensis]|uniref:hypothetical protein n=1 Tax=Paenalcaligenes niemegkensis TaxID=2895469 RepID=UPI001EE96A06|nr:hypothetical protein [Paenalcaligenes niemegkensis]MCQ9618369.1 hypothetical protein [Paenalcaligenes niemegkensis]